MTNVGDLIRNELESQERGVSWLATKLGCSRMAIYRILGKNSVDTAMLYRIGKTLNRNFFSDLSDEFEEGRTHEV